MFSASLRERPILPCAESVIGLDNFLDSYDADCQPALDGAAVETDASSIDVTAFTAVSFRSATVKRGIYMIFIVRRRCSGSAKGARPGPGNTRTGSRRESKGTHTHKQTNGKKREKEKKKFSKATVMELNVPRSY